MSPGRQGSSSCRVPDLGRVRRKASALQGGPSRSLEHKQDEEGIRDRQSKPGQGKEDIHMGWEGPPSRGKGIRVRRVARHWGMAWPWCQSPRWMRKAICVGGRPSEGR